MGTLGKAFGAFGAYIAGSRLLIDYLVNRCSGFIYTTALPQPVAAATRAALRLVRGEPWRRERLRALIARFRSGVEQHGLPLADSATPIQPVILGSAAAALTASRRLRDAGFWVAAIRPPTVPEGSARLRITLSAAHADDEVDALVDALAGACRDLQAA